jgi:hypothetical protein
MRVNTIKKTFLGLSLTLFGVCSVSLHSWAYSLNSSVQSISFSRSARETPPPTKAAPKALELNTSPKGPFAPGTHNISLGVGQVFLLGNLGNSFENAIGPEVHYTYGVSDLFSFQSNFGYHSHSNGTLSIWNMAAGLRANLMYFDQLVPFSTIGLGFYHPSFTYTTGATASGLLFGLQFGAGIDLLISEQVFFGAKLMYNNMFDSSKTSSDGVARNLGGSYMSFMVHAGYTF